VWLLCERKKKKKTGGFGQGELRAKTDRTKVKGKKLGKRGKLLTEKFYKPLSGEGNTLRTHNLPKKRGKNQIVGRQGGGNAGKERAEPATTPHEQLWEQKKECWG